MTRGAQGGFVLWNIPLGRIKIINSVLADVAQLAKLHLLKHHGLDVLEANTQTREFNTINQYLDKYHLTNICFTG